MKDIKDIKILVVGDIMLDKYIECKVDRISPEAPVPVCNVINEYHTLGGCGNVVRNISELGCKVDCLASIGNDNNGQLIKNKLEEIEATPLLFHGSEVSIVKERIIADQRKVQMLRIDREIIKEIPSKSPVDIFAQNCEDEYDMVVISDYAKGMITYGLVEFLKHNQKARIIVDPKPNHGRIYNGVYMITPNEKEWKQMMFSSAYNLNHVKYILETKGSKGMRLINNKTETNEDISSEPVQVYNVSGCGDVVVSVMATCLSLGYDPLKSAKIANKCAGYTAALPGTSVITKQKFSQYKKEVLGR